MTTVATITIFGAGRAKEAESAYILAERVGRALAEAGFAIANGGYRGTMLAAAKGAAGVGGMVIGVTCSAFKNSVANEFVTREIVTTSLDERLRTLVELGHGYIVLPGEFWRPLVELMAKDDSACPKQVAFVESAEQVADLLRKALPP